ncbi:hypothetical protein CAEBREN_21955 [Caenorhabditis brenneri]|uniref:Sdz-33 F-box domain-containing protein n=1 Tax=Caenorhabditis brenneri TaxID=135651 RepID=G0NAD0_CAEBE|nr:hypothetical protein CAEBREN_21955 [Caenorhabditis brenneri]
MTSFSKFPLLQLPRVALANVFRNFDFCAMLMFLINYPKIRHLKLTSPKFGKYLTILVDNHATSPRIRILQFKTDTESGSPESISTRLVEVHGPLTNTEHKDSGIFNVEGFKGNCLANQPMGDNISPFRTYWETEMIGVKVLYVLLCDMYRIRGRVMTIQKGTMWALDSIKSRQVTPLRQLEVVEDKKESLDQEDLKQILTNSRCQADYVTFKAKLPFDLVTVDYTPANFKGLDFHDAPWMTVDTLLALGETCQEITIQNSKLKLIDLKAIMEHWLSGKMKSIKYLQITVRKFWRNRQKFANSVAKYKADLTEESHYESFKEEVFHFNGGVGFKREDGGYILLPLFREKDILTMLFFTK